MLATRELEYDLPTGVVAVNPAEPRDAARLLVAGDSLGAHQHATVRDLPTYLRAGDLLVFNTTRVIPARLIGVRSDTGGAAEGLFLSSEDTPDGVLWTVMLRARRLREGVTVALIDHMGGFAASLGLIRRLEDEPGAWVCTVNTHDSEPIDTLAIVDRIGRTPLPPYIRAARRATSVEVDDELDRVRYQTVYAGASASSVAAPTAGLHFTPTLLGSLFSAGIDRADVELAVGTGTFKSVETEFVEQHPMHEEWCWMSALAMQAVLKARAEGRRVIAVGTTSARTLETFGNIPDLDPTIDRAVNTRLLIAPGYEWKWVDGLITNFHLPRSTLLALVGAMMPGGLEALKATYADAIARGYRFFSYGDAMMVMREGDRR